MRSALTGSAPSSAGQAVPPRDRVGHDSNACLEEQRLPRKEARMHNAGDLAALVAAFFFAVLVCAGVYVLIRLARLISEGTRLVADMRSRSDTVFERVQAAVDRANQQLDATSTVTAGMDELNAGMSQLTDQVSALAGLGQAISAGPAGRAGAFVYGVRRAVAIRRAGTVRPERAVAPAADPAASSAARSVADPAASSAARPVADPAASSAARPVADPAAQSVAQSVARPAAEPVAQPGDGAAAGGPPQAAVASRRSLAPSGGRR